MSCDCDAFKRLLIAERDYCAEKIAERDNALYAAQCQNEKLEAALRERDESRAEVTELRESLGAVLDVVRSKEFMWPDEQMTIRKARALHGAR